MIRIGEKVPDIELEAFHNNEIRKIKLSEYSGKWLVLLFYPGDFTFICPTELEEAADRCEEFKKLHAEIASASVDSVFVHKAWHDISPSIKKVGFPMFSDPTGKLCRAFGTYIEEVGISLRGSFIIDPDGIVRILEMHENRIGRDMGEILRKLQAAIYVREHKEEVCPARWTPGGKTLRPGLEMVGKI